MLNFPRVLGGLALIWGLRAAAEAYVTGLPFWAGSAVLCLVAAGHLLSMRRVALASSALLALIGIELLARGIPLSGLQLMAWYALIVAVTEGRPHDRALLLRTCVTVVYAFAALTKLNPSWLAGEGMAGLILSQPQLTAFNFVAESSSLAITGALVVIAVEAWLAIGLWHRKTRKVTTAIGVLLHTAFLVGASPNLWAAVHLTVFNFGLVAGYPAFWAEIRPTAQRVETAPEAETASSGVR